MKGFAHDGGLIELFHAISSAFDSFEEQPRKTQVPVGFRVVKYLQLFKYSIFFNLKAMTKLVKNVEGNK